MKTSNNMNETNCVNKVQLEAGGTNFSSHRIDIIK